MDLKRRMKLIALAVGTTLLPLFPAAQVRGAAPEKPRILRAKGSLVRKTGGKNVRFRVVLEVLEVGDVENVAMIVSRKRRLSPGAPLMTEEFLWSTDLDSGSVVITDDLKNASVDTGTQMGGWGRIQVEFESTGPMQQGCDSTVNKRPGELTKLVGGTFKLKTGNPVLGNIEKVPIKATAFKGVCGGDVLRGTGPCPTEEKSLSALGSDGENFMEVSTSKKAGAEKAVVSVSAYDYPTNARYYRAMASGRVPAKSLQIANDLDPAELELPDDVAFLSGGIRSRDPEPSEEDKFANCGSDKSYGYVRRNGSIGGVLRIKLTGDRQYEMNKDMVMSGLSVKSKVVREAP